MSRSREKWRSSDTRWSTLATKAQSTYLLSSGSLCISFHSKYTDCNVQFGSERISLITLSATIGDVFSDSFSWYSDRISLLTTNSNRSAFSASNMGRYGDVTGSEISRTLISRTTFIGHSGSVNVHFSMSQGFGHPSFSPGSTDSFLHQFSGQNNPPANVESPSAPLPKPYKDRVSAIPTEDCLTAWIPFVKSPWPSFFTNITQSETDL